MSKLPSFISLKVGSCIVNAKVVDKDHLACQLCHNVVMAKVFDTHVALRHAELFENPNDMKAAAQLRKSSKTSAFNRKSKQP